MAELFAALSHSRLANRILFWLVSLSVLGLIYILAVAPLLSMLGDQRDQIEQLGQRLVRLNALAVRDGEARDLKARFQASRESTGFLTGANEGSASAGLQALLKQLAEQAGAAVQSVQGLESRDDDGTRYIGAHIILSGTPAAIYQTLAAVERNRPYLLVTLLVVRAPTPDPMAVQESRLDLQFEAYGAFRADASRS